MSYSMYGEKEKGKKWRDRLRAIKKKRMTMGKGGSNEGTFCDTLSESCNELSP